jgi:TonB-linked SusC/RagA family outer membrane protein
LTIIDKVIVLKAKEVAGVNEQTEESKLPPQIDITGKVMDEEGNPLKGATVKVRGSTIATSTDENGVFNLNGIDPNATIEISFVGYERTTIQLKSRTSVTASLKKEVQSLNEVVVNKGYYTEKQKLSVSNSVTITSKDIEKQPVSNPLLALQARVPGMSILQANGIPGGGITVRIQGRNNLDNRFVGSDPFIVIDGVPYASQNPISFQGVGFGKAQSVLGSSANEGPSAAPFSNGNPLAFINPADIESITILKDADATAIYGSRAANGAILITTKKGKGGKMKVNVDLQRGWGKVAKKMDLLSSQQYMEMRWEGKRNDGRAVGITDYDLRGVWDTTRYTDWQEELIGGTSQYTRMTAGVSGGTNNFQYLVGTTYGKETTVFPGDFANSFGSLHFNLSASSADQRFKMQLGGSYMVNSNKLPGLDYTTYALNLPPVAPALYNPDGTLNWATDPSTGNSTWYNPLSRQYMLFEMKTHNLVSNGNLSYRILPGLEVKSTFGFTSTNSDQFLADLDESEMPEFRVDRYRNALFSFNSVRSWIVEPQLSFQRNWENHNLSILGGTTFQNQNTTGRALLLFGQPNDLLLRNTGTGLGPLDLDISIYKYNAIFGRLNYALNGKYLLNVTGRRDGSSRFGANSQFANFYSVGAGWIMSEEKFFKEAFPWMSFGKIRGSYGTTGNDQIGNYKFMNLYSTSFGGIPYQNVAGSNPLGLPNPNFEWEETRKLQGGIDLGFLNDRLYVTVNYFRNRTSNNLVQVQMPFVTGFDRIFQNIEALIQNTGWEFLLNSINIKTENFRWSSSVNLTTSSNKVLEFPGLETSTLKSSITLGRPLGTAMDYNFYGVDPLTGLFMVRNRFGEPTTNPSYGEDRATFINQPAPWFGGIQNSFSYKGFSLDLLLQVTLQHTQDIQFLQGPAGYFSSGDQFYSWGNQHVSVMDRWQKPGDIKPYPRFGLGSTSVSWGDLSYRNTSFVRMKNASISYSIENKLLQKIKMQQIKVYANAQNLFTITKYKGLDPETLSISSLPPLRMITIGIQASF